MEVFEEAVRLFHDRKLREARSLFEEAAAGPDRGVAHKAALHARMCERRLEQPAVVLTTAEEHYDYAVALINSRDLAPAQQHLQAALVLDPRGDHLYYALALCRGLAGDLPGAYENLKCAIDLQPRNRIAARQDTDFAEFAHQAPLDRLLFPDKKLAD
jgi:tetratricopeptide (TPR) repeat protein